MRKKAFKWIAICIAVVVTVAMVDFLIWRKQQGKRLEVNSSLAETSEGIIEYATVGRGPAVLVLHGTLGGYDQLQMLPQILGTSAHEFIFVSRPGYLRTPLATGVTFEEQADAYASLLDKLGIDQVAVIAISGGGPSALQFALRYPQRCWAIVMIAANADVNAGNGKEGAKDNQGQPPKFLSKVLLSDFTSWLLVRTAKLMPKKILALLVGEDYVEAVMRDPVRRKLFAEMMSSVVLLSQRRAGALNDGNQYLNFTGYPFKNIIIPTLILHGTKDCFVGAAEQAHLHETLPNAKYIEIKGGTHFMPISHYDILGPLIVNFLNMHTPLE